MYGNVTGHVQYNGGTVSAEDLRNSIGMVPQPDIMYTRLTVEQNLMFNFHWRNPCGDGDECEKLATDTIQCVLKQLSLSEYAQSTIVKDDGGGLSGGQKKRVSIGMELVANPSVIFMDEPTTSLDSVTSEQITIMMKDMAKDGKTVISIVHQPSLKVFKMFDSLTVMARGGFIVYHGPADMAESYFQGQFDQRPDEDDIVSDWIMRLVEGANPADLAEKW
eukprot:COSAG06_NODE_21845_length_743_cov_1.079193_1_plen_219_part_10